MFNGMESKETAVALFGADKFIHPYKSGFAVFTEHANGGHVQIGFFLEHGKMSDDPYAIASFADDILIRPTARTALLFADGESFYVKFIGIDGQDLADF
ncbi:hypothetical protein ABD76_27305 [Paenibacillus dendritiformis]|nr:hypothetical protein [Paenibacillus dendritiformis]MBG9793795.1 hypothetical protein [Paenibacillus dendritiformis]MBG9795948.1 hypothetical protein [Paenibacillus dendritiformis]